MRQPRRGTMRAMALRVEGRWSAGSGAASRAAACHSWLTAAARLCGCGAVVEASWAGGLKVLRNPGFPLGGSRLCQCVQDVNQVPHRVQSPAAGQQRGMQVEPF